MKIIKSFDEITATWLETILNLDKGSICSINLERIQNQFISKTVIANIEYSKKDTNAPSSVFVKMTNMNIPKEFACTGKKEVFFYNELKTKYNIGNTPLCYYSVYDEEEYYFNTVLENLSKTHFQTDYPIPPIVKYQEICTECLAKFHSIWWGKNEEFNTVIELPTKEDLQKEYRKFNEWMISFFEFMGDRISSSQKYIFENVIGRLDFFQNRYLEYDRLTLIHADAHYWNYFYPVSEENEVKLFDWDSYRTGVCTDDLSYMIAVHLYRDQRKDHETYLLKHYYNILIQSGVKKYSYEDLISDYRYSVLRSILIPLWQWNVKIPSFVWFNHLGRIMQSFEDWNCIELLH